jgi:diguanylate cyclase (GGDEF)-like protein
VSNALQRRVIVATAVAFFASVFVARVALWTRGTSPAAAPIELAVTALYGTLTAIGLARRRDDLRVRLFAFTGVQVVLSVLLSHVALAPSLSFGFLALLAVRHVVYVAAPPVFVHTAAMIPRRNALLDRYRWLLPGLYGVSGLAAAALYVLAVVGLRGDGAAMRLFVRLFAGANHVGYAIDGIVGLILLASAARREDTAQRRGQALVVLLGLAPWTARILFMLAAPAFYATLPATALFEPIVILLVPVSFFVAIFGLGLFELPAVVRRSLIYGLTLALLGAAAYLLWVAAGTLATRTLGFEPTVWNVALVLVTLGLAARPLVARVTRAVDRLFFPEKLALQALQHSLLAELAPLTDIDRIAEHLVRRLQAALALRGAVLLVADETRAFFRVRATAESTAGGPAHPAVVRREDLDRCASWEGTVAVVAPERSGEGAVRCAEFERTLRELGAGTLVRIELTGDPVAVLALGPSLSGSEFDRGDRTGLALLARQAAAMLENARLFDLATTDPLTGLPRRNVFDERLATELERSARADQPLSVAIADLDRFKSVNDTWGHAAGDQALRCVAAVFGRGCRATDTVARYGGEEFAVLFPNTTTMRGAVLAERLRSALAATPFSPAPGADHPLTVSIGVCGVVGRDARLGSAELMRRADEALYQAKTSGRNRVEVYREAI